MTDDFYCDEVLSGKTEVQLAHGAARTLTNLGSYQDSKHLHLHFHVNHGDPRS